MNDSRPLTEIQTKLAGVRRALEKNGLGGVRLRGVDWFAWVTGGANSVVFMATEGGVGEVLITPEKAWVLTNRIEERRFRDEEISSSFELWAGPWQDGNAQEKLVREQTKGRLVASDRPRPEERGLPDELVRLKRTISGEEEHQRYRRLGRDAAEAMTEALAKAEPGMSEFELAGLGASAMFSRGLHPTLVLVAGEERLPKYRHPFPASKRLGSRAMMVYCARRGGLYANLTRFVYFKEPSEADRKQWEQVARIEAAAFRASRPGLRLHESYRTLLEAYREEGMANEIDFHHQGGTTGYLSRELIATPWNETLIDDSTAFAWNPSLPGMKIEDTVLSTKHGIEVLTVDPQWPVREVHGLKRPDLWVRK